MLLVTISRISLAVLNLLTLIFGLSLIVVGILLKYNDREVIEKVLKYTMNNEAGQEEKVKQMADLLIGEKEMFSFVIGASISLGTFILILSLLGFIGLLIRLKVILLSYIALMSLMIVINISFLIAFILSKSKVESHMQSGIKASADKLLLPYNRIETNSSESSIPAYTFSKVLNTIQAHQNCCFFEKTDDLAETMWKQDVFPKNLYLPLGCCKFAGQKLGEKAILSFKNSSQTLDLANSCGHNSANYNTKSCSKLFAAGLKSHFNPIIGLLSTGITFELLCIVIAIISLPTIEE